MFVDLAEAIVGTQVDDQCCQLIVADAEEVREFVNDCVSHLLAYFIFAGAQVFNGPLKDGDLVGENEAVVRVALGERLSAVSDVER